MRRVFLEETVQNFLETCYSVKLPIFSEIISDWSTFYETLQARANSVNKTLFKVGIKNELQPNQTLL